MDKNIVMLEGVIGNDFKYGKTQDGKRFATFTLVIKSNNKISDIKDDDEKRFPETYIRVMCFDKKQVEYLESIGAHSGHHASVFARLSSHKTEYRGVEYIQNNVVVRDISITKTKQ